MILHPIFKRWRARQSVHSNVWGTRKGCQRLYWVIGLGRRILSGWDMDLIRSRGVQLSHLRNTRPTISESHPSLGILSLIWMNPLSIKVQMLYLRLKITNLVSIICPISHNRQTRLWVSHSHQSWIMTKLRLEKVRRVVTHRGPMDQGTGIAITDLQPILTQPGCWTPPQLTSKRPNSSLQILLMMARLSSS